MRIVLITREGMEHAYVANLLCDSLPVAAVVLDLGKKQGAIDRIRSLLRRYPLPVIVSRSFGRLVSIVLRDSSSRCREFRKVLGAENCHFRLGNVPVIPVEGINTPAAIAKVRELGPDLILVYGTGIIGRTILELPALGALNMHTGISPFYRGADCAFWPLFNTELDMLGATVHDCTPAVDGGCIHAVARSVLAADDNFFSVFARSVKAGGQIYVDVVRSIMENGRTEGTAQDLRLGTEYKASMKTWWREMLVRIRIRNGLIRDFVRAAYQGANISATD